MGQYRRRRLRPLDLAISGIQTPARQEACHHDASALTSFVVILTSDMDRVPDGDVWSNGGKYNEAAQYSRAVQTCCTR